ncbi:MAG: hypothetical protein FJX61_09505 [Alphaproteobacteria bacterium]|nr:hypothetical protein [Alphaproteobacteria bacterium]
MDQSTRVLRLLKIASTMGMVFNLLMAVLLVLIAIFWKDSNSMTWTSAWFALSIGIPMFGMLYVTLKNREYLRDVLGALQKK